MTDAEYVQYLLDAEAAVVEMARRVDVILHMAASNVHEEFGYTLRAHFLRFKAVDTLKVIQSPVEVGDYCQRSLKRWRDQIRRLDKIAEDYLRSLYRKN